MTRSWLVWACLLWGAVSLLPGCYFSHEWSPSPPDGGPPNDARDAPDAPAPLEEEDVCELLCDAMERACPARGCYESCDARRRAAARRDCLTEWKSVTRCVIEHPCSDGECGDSSGWPACLRGRSRP